MTQFESGPPKLDLRGNPIVGTFFKSDSFKPSCIDREAMAELGEVVCQRFEARRSHLAPEPVGGARDRRIREVREICH